MKHLDLDNVKEDYDRPQAGGYVCKIKKVEDVPIGSNAQRPESGDYLKIDYDFAEGPFVDYYAGMCDHFGFWGGTFIRSYKPKALGMFKGFIKALEESNDGFKWNDDEKALAGLKVGLVLGSEEYRGNDGAVKTRLRVARVLPVEKIHEGEFEIPPLKKLEESNTSNAVVDTTKQESFEAVKDDVPF